MNNKVLIGKNIAAGSASRYIKPRWVQGGKLSTEAFDLRDGTPPEAYVSHFLVNENSLEENFNSAHTIISKKITDCRKGGVAILEIFEVLAEVNDEAEPFIEFTEQGLPHCGLVYLTAQQEKIQEAKATLCLLAEKKLTSVKSIETSKASLCLRSPAQLSCSQRATPLITK